MRVIVLGAGGRLGSRVVESAVAAGHDVTAFVRSAQRFRECGVSPAALARVRIVEGDVGNAEQLRRAMKGHQAAVQAAGYIGGTYELGKPLQHLVGCALRAAGECLEEPRRLWVLAGAGALDIPGRPGHMIVSVPGVPSKYLIHKENFDLLQLSGASLDWSLACPGNMFASPDGRAPADPSHVRVVVDEAPMELPGWSKHVPVALLLPAMAKTRHQASP